MHLAHLPPVEALQLRLRSGCRILPDGLVNFVLFFTAFDPFIAQSEGRYQVRVATLDRAHLPFLLHRSHSPSVRKFTNPLRLDRRCYCFLILQLLVVLHRGVLIDRHCFRQRLPSMLHEELLRILRLSLREEKIQRYIPSFTVHYSPLQKSRKFDFFLLDLRHSCDPITRI